MPKFTNGYQATIELLIEDPEWKPIVESALEMAKTTSGGFAGAWILDRAKKRGIPWVPNFKKLTAYGILEKDGESSRGGNRAYYKMHDVPGVEKALREFGDTKIGSLYPGHKVTDSGISKVRSVVVPMYANLASCGSPNDSEVYVDDYREIDSELAKPGFQYYLVRAEGDSMNTAGINNGDLVLVRVQDYANIGDRVVALTEDGPVIKEFHRQGNSILLIPRSDNPIHKPLLLDNVEIQGVVVTIIPK